MSRAYTVTMDNATIVGADTLVYLRPAADQAIEIYEVRIGFSANTTSAQQRVQLVSQVVSGSPVSTAVNPAALDEGSPTCSITGGTGNQAAGTAGHTVTTESGGAQTVLVADAFNHLTGWTWNEGADGPIKMAANSGSIFGVYFPSTPGTTTGWSCTVAFREV